MQYYGAVQGRQIYGEGLIEGVRPFVVGKRDVYLSGFARSYVGARPLGGSAAAVGSYGEYVECILSDVGNKFAAMNSNPVLNVSITVIKNKVFQSIS